MMAQVLNSTLLGILLISLVTSWEFSLFRKEGRHPRDQSNVVCVFPLALKGFHNASFWIKR
jgi:hypothetical protein